MAILVADFETTVYSGQDKTEVWAAALAGLWSDDEPMVFTSIWDFLYQGVFMIKDRKNIIYFHNLKFDGNFIIAYLLKNSNYFKQGFDESVEDRKKFKRPRDLNHGEFCYSISSKNQWYSLSINWGGKLFEFRDSLKLLPFSLDEISKAFNTPHKKLDIEYKGKRTPGENISKKERAYIMNDALVLKEAMEFMLGEGNDKLTIGACALSEFKSIYNYYAFKEDFPNLNEREAVVIGFGSLGTTADKYIRKSYKGGWCYVKKGCENIVYENGVTLDVNSLYPYVMSGDSGNRYPVGLPSFWKGNYIPEEAQQPDKYYFIRIITRFYIKPGFFPTIQIKGSLMYNARRWLDTSDIWDRRNKRYAQFYKDFDGSIKPARVELTLTQTDFELLKTHYELEEFEILDGCYFDTKIGIFDEYIDKYRKIKETSKGAKRTEAKLFLNNLYGKMATSDDSTYKVAFLDDEGVVRFEDVEEHEKQTVYIPIGAAITSYARYYTISAAQRNFSNFVYADTDSLHCACELPEIHGITLHKTKFGCWDDEKHWEKGIFVRQKTYIEVSNGNYSITCAGMPNTSKRFMELSLSGYKLVKRKQLKVGMSIQRYKIAGKLKLDTPEKIEFLQKTRTIEDFKEGLVLPGCLKARTIPGGIILRDDYYTLRGALRY